jgi:hypothetical protein
MGCERNSSLAEHYGHMENATIEIESDCLQVVRSLLTRNTQTILKVLLICVVKWLQIITGKSDRRQAN